MKAIGMVKRLKLAAFSGGILLALQAAAEVMVLPWTIVSVSSDGVLSAAVPYGTDLSYPPPGQRAPVLEVGARNVGVAITEDEFRARQAKPHLVFFFPTVERLPAAGNESAVGTQAAGTGGTASGSPPGGQGRSSSSSSALPQTGGHRH